MMRKNSLLLAIFLIVVGCTIIEDDYLEDFPEDVRLNGIQINYTDATYTTKQINAEITYSSNKIDVNFIQGIDFLFLNSNVEKITYLLNASGYAEKITTSFENGTIVTDDLVYNSSNQIIEMDNSFFNDKLRLFYFNNELDSVGKIRTLATGATQSGAYKFDTISNSWVSIFPLDKTVPYSFTDESGFSCNSNQIIIPDNELFKTSYNFRLTAANNYYVKTNITCNYKVKRAESYCYYTFEGTSDTYTNYYKKENLIRLEDFPSCNNACGEVNYDHLSVLTLVPGVVPNANEMYMLSLENELRQMGSNSPKSFQFNLSEVKFLYEPSK